MGPCGCGWGRPEAPLRPDILFIGPERAGKSLLLQRLRVLHAKQGRRRRGRARGAVAPDDAAADEGCETLPTVGTELITIPAGRRWPAQRLLAREVGGQMLPLWPVYYTECLAAAFVLDASSRGAAAEAAVELFEALAHPDLEGKPVCLVINKCDAPDTLARWELELALRLPDLAALNPGRLAVIYTSARNGEAVGDVLDWMLAAREAGAAAREGAAARAKWRAASMQQRAAAGQQPSSGGAGAGAS